MVIGVLMFQQAVEALFPNNTPAHIITYENEFCQRAKYIDLRQVQNPQTELFQYWVNELPTELPFPFQHNMELHGDAANKSRNKTNHKNWTYNPFLTIEVDELIYKSLYQNQELNWPDDQSHWLKETQKAAMINAAIRAGLPYTVAIDSGNKSIHFVFRLGNDDIEKYKDPKGEYNYLFKYLQMLLVYAFGDYDNGVFKQSGYKLTRSMGAVRDNGAMQNILDVKNNKPTVQDLITWCETQLSPEVLEWVRTHANYSYKEAKKSPYCLIYDQYFKDLILGHEWYQGITPDIAIRGKGERGTAWFMISKKLALAGQRDPYTIMPQYDSPLAQYDASFLWHMTAWAFNETCNPPLWGDADMLRWEKDNLDEMRADPQTHGMPSDMSTDDFQLAQLFSQNAAAVDPAEAEKDKQRLIKTEAARHKEVAKTNPTFKSNIAGIGAALSSSFGGDSDDFNYGAEAAITIGLIKEQNINLKYIVDNDEARRESWWLYCDIKHIWERLHKLAAEKLIEGLRPDLSHLSPYKIGQLIAVIRKELLHNQTWSENQYMFIFRNGTFRFTGNMNPNCIGDLAVFYPDQFSPDDYAQVLLDYNFDQRILTDLSYNWMTEAPAFSEFINNLFESPEDDNRAAQEFLGQGLWPFRQHQKILIVRGSGGDGKGVLMSIIKATLGGRVPYSDYRPEYDTKAVNGHAETFSVDKLAEKHAGSMFVGQRLLIDEEIKVMKKIDDIIQVTSVLKKISGDGEIMREDKGKQISKEKTEARLILCCNNEPQFVDTNKGIWRRLVILRCRPVPKGRVEIDRFHEGFLTQDILPHIFNYHLTGLYMYACNRAAGRPGITMTPVLDQRVLDLRSDADIVTGFFSMYMEPAMIALANEQSHKRYNEKPISLDILLTMINQYAFESNEKYTVKRKDLENALTDNSDLAGKERIYEFARSESATKHGTIGVPSRSKRIKVLLGYTCTYPGMQEMAGDMHHAWVRTQTKDFKPVNQGANFQGGV